MAGGWWQLRAGKVLHRSLNCRHASYGAVVPGTERCQPVEWIQSARVASVGAQWEEMADTTERTVRAVAVVAKAIGAAVAAVSSERWLSTA